MLHCNAVIPCFCHFKWTTLELEDFQRFLNQSQGTRLIPHIDQLIDGGYPQEWDVTLVKAAHFNISPEEN